jgi:CRISPR-associated protein Csm4
MCSIYRLSFHLRGPFLTPWQADTLFGHLCWALRWRKGPDAVTAFLDRYEASDPPILLSNGFPGDWLPKPVFPSSLVSAADPAELQGLILDREESGRQEWLSPVEFNAWRSLPTVVRPGRHDGLVDEETRTLFKNKINRRTGTTAAVEEEEGLEGEGNLFAVEERFLPESRLSVYARIVDDWLDTARTLFADVAHTGYGRKKSSGYGQFDFDPEADLAPYDGFDEVPGANGFISLSNWVPGPNDPVDGYYRAWVKYGRLGEVYAVQGSDRPPFKQPLVMLEAGACFRVEQPKPYYGRLVRGVHRDDPDIVQYGLAFDLPIRFPSA